MEGFYQGLIGAIISISILGLLYSLQSYLIESFVRFQLVVPEMMIISNLLAGVALGLIGSYRGISKYLK